MVKEKAQTTRTTGTRGKARVFLGFIYIVVGVSLIYGLLSNAMVVFQQKQDIDELEKQKEMLNEEKELLENEIELLNDDDYVTRYARENYVFTREGEHVTIIPSMEEE